MWTCWIRRGANRPWVAVAEHPDQDVAEARGLRYIRERLGDDARAEGLLVQGSGPPWRGTIACTCPRCLPEEEPPCTL